MQSAEMVTDRDTYAATVWGLAEDIGYDKLACLNVTVDEIHLWAAGKRRPPTELFLKMVDMTQRAA